jgi:hypothetical protein
MMHDAGLLMPTEVPYLDPTTGYMQKLSQSDIKKRFDLIFCSTTSHNQMTFDQFLQSVLKMC